MGGPIPPSAIYAVIDRYCRISRPDEVDELVLLIRAADAEFLTVRDEQQKRKSQQVKPRKR